MTTRSSPIDLHLPAVALTQNQELFDEMQIVYNALRLVAQAVDDTPLKLVITAYETLAYGNILGFRLDGGVVKACKAQDAVYRAWGFCSSYGGTAAGQATELTLQGKFPGLAAGSLTAGSIYYLSAATPGAITTVGTTQRVGIALSDTELLWRPQT